jgi:hypothetical protein
MSEWINIKDQSPPKDGTWILTQTVYGTYTAVRYCVGWDGKLFYDDSYEYSTPEEHMIRWMLLPEIHEDSQTKINENNSDISRCERCGTGKTMISGKTAFGWICQNPVCIESSKPFLDKVLK